MMVYIAVGLFGVAIGVSTYFPYAFLLRRAIRRRRQTLEMLSELTGGPFGPDAVEGRPMDGPYLPMNPYLQPQVQPLGPNSAGSSTNPYWSRQSQTYTTNIPANGTTASDTSGGPQATTHTQDNWKEFPQPWLHSFSI